MRTFEVNLNRCTDTQFENDITCDCCREKGSVAIICGRRICYMCLTAAQVAIQREIYTQIEKKPPYTELPTQGSKK